MNDRKLIDYLPPVLRSVQDFVEITDAQQPEIERAWAALNVVMDNQFIDAAAEDGVAVWEKELGILPLSTETLERRKQRIKAAWAYGAVYTYKWLASWLAESCGEASGSPTVEDYTLRLEIPVSHDYYRILKDVESRAPANMLIMPTVLLSESELVQYVGSVFWLAVKQTAQSDQWDTSKIAMLADENGFVLLEELGGKVMYEEV